MTTYHHARHSVRDRHGRGLRGVLLPPGLPTRRSPQRRFDEFVLAAVADVTAHLPQVADIEFAVEEVPPSDPAPWEGHQTVFGRCFPADRHRGLACRIVLYRLPLQGRCRTIGELRETVGWVIVENVANALALSIDDVVPPAWGRPHP